MQRLAELTLASASPRRRAFLAGAGLAAAVVPVDLDETPHPAEAPDDYVARMAREKAQASDASGWVLASDTVVVHGGHILGKPADSADAARMLAALSGDTHHVLTAWALRRGPELIQRTSRTGVRFRPLTAEDIADYVASGEPFDKAGAYGIQGGAGDFVEAVDGDYDTVVGLPLSAVVDALAERAVRFDSAIEQRAAVVKGRIAAAAQGAGRDPAEVTLVAVSKAQPVAAAQAAVAAGLLDLGENYAQELVEKAAIQAARWHFIGRLQTNKAKLVAPLAHRIHGVDSVRLARALDARATAPLPALIQVNLAGEASKGGVAPDQVEPLLDACAALPNLRVDGLMTVPPTGSRAQARRYFAQLAALRDRLAHSERPLPQLSMGMSGDFEQAIAMGATLVRVGTAIFGHRTG